MKTDTTEYVEYHGSSPRDSVHGELQRLNDKAFALSDRDARAGKVLAGKIYSKAGDVKSPYCQVLSRYITGLYLHNLSEYDSAMEEFEHADQIAQEHSLPNLRSSSVMNMGARFSRSDGTIKPSRLNQKYRYTRASPQSMGKAHQ